MKFFLYRNDQQQGPFTLAEIRSMIVSGDLAPGDLAWHKGLADWTPLAEVEALKRPQGRAESPLVSKVSAITFMGAQMLAKQMPMLKKLKDEASRAFHEAVDVDDLKQQATKALESQLPRIRRLVKEHGPKLEQAAKDEKSMTRVFAAAYRMMPRAVQLLVDRESFIRFCMEHRDKIFSHETTHTPEDQHSPVTGEQQNPVSEDIKETSPKPE